MAIVAQSTGQRKWKHTLVRFLHYMWRDRKRFEGRNCDKLKMNIANPRAATDKVNKETLSVKGIGVQRQTTTTITKKKKTATYL